MIFCKHCVYPETKPDLTFNSEGVCSACTAFKSREYIDWPNKAADFVNLCEYIKKPDKPYDCIIPVSGGKDSHYQIIKALEHGLRPLAVTATTDALSDLGASNLDNITRLGVDHIIVTTNGNLRRRINNYTLTTIGDISWAEHVTIFTVPFREALIRKIPLIIWGENPQNEYGGPEQDKSTMKQTWLQEFGGLNGLRVSDLIERGIATQDELFQYTMPNDVSSITPIYLGHYFEWDGKLNAETAKEYGFRVHYKDVEGTGVNYENLDNYQTGIHDYFKWLKFGFGRATDIACNHIRRGYFTRNEGKEFVYLYDGKFPNTYLGRSLESILSDIGMSISEFMQICDKFTNKALFEARTSVSPRPRLRHNVMEI